MKLFKMKHLAKRSRVLAVSGIAAATSLLATSATAREMDKAVDSETVKMKIYVDDLKGQSVTGFDNARDDLLQNAIYDAAKRTKWLDKAELEYNQIPDEDERNYLYITVVDWERSRTNFYEFRASAKYINADGKEIDLGSFSAMESGIAVTNTNDVGEQFSAAAESAISDALEELEEKLMKS